MVTIGMNYFVIPGKEKVFEDACANVVETMGGIEGHETSSLYKEVSDGEPTYLIVSSWKALTRTHTIGSASSKTRASISSGPR